MDCDLMGLLFEGSFSCAPSWVVRRGKGGVANQRTEAQHSGPWRMAIQGACPATNLPSGLIRRQ